MRDQKGFDRFLKFEFSKIYSSVVTRKHTLKKLLEMEEPTLRTRDDSRYDLDKGMLELVGEHLPSYKHGELKIPIDIHFDLKIENQCYISDELAAEVVRKLEGFGEAYRYRDGKMWLPLSLSMELLRKYPTIFQRMVYPG